MVGYCPTEGMLAGFYKKPLQGKIFRRFQNMILNIQKFDYPSLFNSLDTGNHDQRTLVPQEYAGVNMKYQNITQN